jgi:GMP synthase (glutamine-hydrolysing)
MAVRTPAGGEFFGTQYHPELDLAVVAAILQLRAAGLAAEGFARTEAELHRLADDYRAMSEAPDRQDFAWRYGIGPGILDPLQRSLEIGDWLASTARTRRRVNPPTAALKPPPAPCAAPPRPAPCAPVA